MNLSRFLALSGCILAFVLTAPGCHPPQARYWQDRPNRPRPLAKPDLALAWDRPLPFCPDEVVVQNDRILLRQADSLPLWLDAEGQPSQAPEISPAASPGGAAEALEGAIATALEHRYGRLPETTAAARWESLAIVAVPEERAVHAIHVSKKRITWTVRTGTRVVQAPQIYRARVLVQSLDNSLYCLLPDNGHEVWRAVTSHRLTRRASFWNDRVLVIPETSRTVQIFDLFDGSSAARWTLPERAHVFRGAPVVLGDLAVAPHAPVGTQRCSLAALTLGEKDAAPAP